MGRSEAGVHMLCYSKCRKPGPQNQRASPRLPGGCDSGGWEVLLYGEWRHGRDIVGSGENTCEELEVIYKTPRDVK